MGVFSTYGYRIENLKGYDIAIHTGDVHDYWLFLTDFSLDEQSKIAQNLKEDVINEPAFLKNISILYVRRQDSIDLSKVDNETLEIENDPYYFKKYVLPYTEEAESELKSTLDGLHYPDRSIADILMDKEVFKKLKGENAFGAYHLLYAISHKLPFITMNVEQKDFDDVVDFKVKPDSYQLLLDQIKDITEDNAEDVMKKLIEKEDENENT